MTTNNNVRADIITLTRSEAKEQIRDLIFGCAILPESKVRGVDMFGRASGNAGLQGLLKLFEKKLTKTMGQFDCAVLFQEAKDEADDLVQRFLDNDDDLNKNEEIDDLETRFGAYEMGRIDDEFNGHVDNVARVYGVAGEAQERHMRQAMRLAIMDKLIADKRDDLKASVNDDLAARLLAGEHKFDKGLMDFVVDVRSVAKKSSMILAMNNASYFRKKLEDKAILLREMSFKAERATDGDYIGTVINLAKKTMRWCKVKMNNPRPYSKRAINALWNEAVDTLHALGALTLNYEGMIMLEYKSTERCSFFTKKTQEDMVEVKEGTNWADELRVMFYGVDDGTSRTPVRGSEA